MKEFWKLFWRMVLLSGMVMAAVAVFLISPPGPNQANFFAAILDKQRMLREMPSPRIILVGGSSLAFGMDSELISKTFNRPVVNMGLHAGMGLNLMLAQVRPNLRAGDMIVLVPEYELFCGGYFDGDDSVLANILEIDRKTLFLLDANQLSRLPWIAKYLIQYRYLRQANARQFESEFYGRAAFNANGDATRHLDQKPVRPVTGGDYILTYEQTKNLAVIPALNEFQRDAAAKGARVLFFYPNAMASVYDQSTPEIQKLVDDLRAHLEIPILGAPQDFRLDDPNFFDTTYHLTRAGRDIRTQRFIGLLQAHLTPR